MNVSCNTGRMKAILRGITEGMGNTMHEQRHKRFSNLQPIRDCETFRVGGLEHRKAWGESGGIGKGSCHSGCY